MALRFVLPNKRAGLFLKKALVQKVAPSSFLPQIQSIEEFMVEVSSMEVIEPMELLFIFYEVYCAISPKDRREGFEKFSKWALPLIQDFNELDLQLKDVGQIFEYVYQARRIEHWGLDELEDKNLVNAYLEFHKAVPELYAKLSAKLKSDSCGYQGLVYRQALESLEVYLDKNPTLNFVFLGFNALTEVEEASFQLLLEKGRCRVYWDIDNFFYQQKSNTALFFLKYQNQWKYYQNHPMSMISQGMLLPKNLELNACMKKVVQVKRVAELLQHYQESNEIDQTALVLGDEALLPVLLNSLPESLKSINITMGYPLKQGALYRFYEAFYLLLNQTRNGDVPSWYYKDIDRLFSTQALTEYLDEAADLSQVWTELKQKLGAINYDRKTIFEAYGDRPYFALIQTLFRPVKGHQIEDLLNRSLEIIDIFRKRPAPGSLAEESLFQFSQVFHRLSHMQMRYPYIENQEAFNGLFQQLCGLQKLSFEGEPLSGLQVMGVLESRLLDFKNVIIVSVNEGSLPQNTLSNSFVPFDIKREYALPLYKEKDAIYAYHFFRLLQRAENVHLLYNEASDDFGSGEPSRFIKQLETYHALGLLPELSIHKKNVYSRVKTDQQDLDAVEKSAETLEILQDLAAKGFSPSTLSSYIRDPLEFYRRRILKIPETPELMEEVQANTFGTVVHESLYALYLPFLNQILSEEQVKGMEKLAEGVVVREFKRHFKGPSRLIGKNYLSLEMAKAYVKNYLIYEREQIKKGAVIELLQLEKEIKIEHYVCSIGRSVVLKGNVDRIDRFNGQIRVIDYKTGSVDPRDLNILDWDRLIEEDRYAKLFQVLTYTYLFLSDKGGLGAIAEPAELRSRIEAMCSEGSIEAGIISLKFLKYGFISAMKGKIGPAEVLNYLDQLDRLIGELFDPTVAFVEKETEFS